MTIAGAIISNPNDVPGQFNCQSRLRYLWRLLRPCWFVVLFPCLDLNTKNRARTRTVSPACVSSLSQIANTLAFWGIHHVYRTLRHVAQHTPLLPPPESIVLHNAYRRSSAPLSLSVLLLVWPSDSQVSLLTHFKRLRAPGTDQFAYLILLCCQFPFDPASGPRKQCVESRPSCPRVVPLEPKEQKLQTGLSRALFALHFSVAIRRISIRFPGACSKTHTASSPSPPRYLSWVDKPGAQHGNPTGLWSPTLMSTVV